MSKLVLVIFFVGFYTPHFAATAAMPGLFYPRLVDKLYSITNHHILWLNNTDASSKMRAVLLQKIENAADIGSSKEKYRYDELFSLSMKAGKAADSAELMKMDMRFTDAAIAYCKDIYQGNDVSKEVSYDEWTKRYADSDNDFIINHLAAIGSANDLAVFMQTLEPATKDYVAYKTELAALYKRNDKQGIRQLYPAMNLYRWIHHFNFPRVIVVNTCAATLHYYEHDKEVLFSRAIVGKPATRTPRFAASSQEVILYPYWNVPRSIAVKELLPKYKRSPSRVNAENMQVLNAQGKIVSPYAVNWSQYSAGYFPYRLRQSTGCDNSLGILKFNLTSPFGVYLHDTNTKGLFGSANRHRSHGCMRVEKAIELGNLVLNNKLDTAYLQACIKGEKPVTTKFEQPIPVFVIYATAETEDGGVVRYFKDVYHLLQAK